MGEKYVPVWGQAVGNREEDAKKYVVPEGGLKAALGQVDYVRAHSGVEEGIIKRALQDFVRWLSENPIVPTDEQRADLSIHIPYQDCGNGAILSLAAVEWQKRMFLAPEPEISEVIKDLLWDSVELFEYNEEINYAITEAYRRGKEGK